MKSNLYYCINKDSTDVEGLYEAFENIIKSKAVLSRAKSGYKNSLITMNGDNYISVTRKIAESKYKVPIVNRMEFKKSNLSLIYKNYKDYLRDLQTETFSVKPVSQKKFFAQNNMTNRRLYYRYLDSISRLYPIDLEVLLRGCPTDKIVQYIFAEVNKSAKYKNIGYFYATENAYTKYIKNSKGIVLVIDGGAPTQKTTLIPNLESDFFDEEMQLNIANSQITRYTNLIGELQIKDKIDLKFIKTILVDRSLDVDMIKAILKKYGIKIKVQFKN
jgi:hypothetical protein